MIKNIIFDIGNVLASFRPREVLEEMGLDETEVNVILDATVRGPYWVELDRGVMEEAEVIEAMRSRVPQRYLADFERFFAEETGKLVKSLPYAADWLKGLKERGYHVYLLSNYPVGLFEIHSPHFTFLPYTDGRVVSGYVKCVKPDERIYRCLLEKYSLRPQECVFLDDLAENVEGQKSLESTGFASWDMRMRTRSWNVCWQRQNKSIRTQKGRRFHLEKWNRRPYYLLSCVDFNLLSFPGDPA